MATVIGILIAISPLVYAQSETELSSPAIMPDSPLYGLGRAWENLQLFFTFDDVGKANLHYRFAEYRLAEAEVMSNRNRTDLAQRALSEYENELNETDQRVERAVALGKNITALIQHVNAENYKHLLVLERVRNKLTNKIGVDKAIDMSAKEHSKIFQKFDNRELVNVTVTSGNRTVTLTVPARLADEFFEKVESIQNKTTEKLVKIEIKADKALNAINAAQAEIDRVSALSLKGAGPRLLEEAKKHLDRAKEAYANGKYGMAFGQATAAGVLARNAERASGFARQPPANQTNQPPQWSNIVTQAPSQEGPITNLTIDWKDFETSVSLVLIEHNGTGSNVNYTASLLSGNTYGIQYNFTAGTYQWRSFANDTQNAFNVSDTQTFTIAPQNQT